MPYARHRSRPWTGRVRALAAALAVVALPLSTAPAAATNDDEAPPGDASVAVTVTIPPGALSFTGETVDDRSGVLLRVVTTRLVVTDTRAGDHGFALSLSLPRGAAPALVGVRAEQVPGNALAARDVRTAKVGLVAPGAPLVVARYPAGLGLGSVVLTATVVTARGGRDAGLVWTVL